MRLFGNRKSDRKVLVLMMDSDAHGELTRIMEEMTEAKRGYAMQGVCLNFVKLLYGKRLRQYQEKNIMALFPNHWDSPLYRSDRPDMEQIAIDCAADFIRKYLPAVAPEQAVISVDTFPGKPFAGVFIEY